MTRAFIDTNILVYAADEAAQESRKTHIARELLLQRGLHLSVQVLNEFIANARSSKKLNLSPQQEHDWVERWLLFPIHGMSYEMFLEARLFHERYGVSHWDGLILAAAIEAQCTIVYSEDLQHGQKYGETTVKNPFL